MFSKLCGQGEQADWERGEVGTVAGICGSLLHGTGQHAQGTHTRHAALCWAQEKDRQQSLIMNQMETKLANIISVHSTSALRSPLQSPFPHSENAALKGQYFPRKAHTCQEGHCENPTKTYKMEDVKRDIT